MRYVVCLLLLMMTVAGCSDAPASTTDEEEVYEEFALEATQETGIIRGVVVDPSIVPIPDATVTVGKQSTQTNKDGAFGFKDIEPGFHALLVDKAGYGAVSQQVEVVAGVDAPPVVRVLLEAEPSELPRVVPFKFDGHLECAATTPAYRVAVCSVPNIVTDLAGQPPLIDDRFMATFPDLETGVQWMQNEMVWRSTQPAGDRMSYVVEVETNVDETEIGNPWGASPVVHAANETMLANASFVDYFQLRVFNFEHPATEPPVPVCGIDFPLTGEGCVKGVGMTIQQDFEVFTHLFYNSVPAEGWQFSIDGDPKPVMT